MNNFTRIKQEFDMIYKIKHIYFPVYFFMTCVFLSSCSTTSDVVQNSISPKCPIVVPSAELTTIYIDNEGYLRDPKNDKQIKGENATKTIEMEKNYVENIFQEFYIKQNALQLLDPNRKLELTMFIHGGLNNFGSASHRSAKFTKDMICDAKNPQYPIFVMWRSGGPTNYIDHLFRIRKGENRLATGIVTSPIVLVEDIARSLSRIPSSVWKEISDPFKVPKSLNFNEEKDYQIRADRLKDAMFDVHNSPPYVGVGKSYLTVINPIKLITAPFIDGLGSGAWDHMLRRTDLILSKSAAFEGPIPICDDSTKKSCDNYYDTAATLFLKKLESDPDFKAVPLNLIAHSMGSIVANNILARHPNLPFQNVVYMGAATRIKDLETVLVPWMRSNLHQKSNFYNLSLDPYRELGENAYYDFLPRGSLLNWIDFTFGEINSFKDRQQVLGGI